MAKRRRSEILKKLKKVYEEQYKKLLIIPFLMLVLALVQIGVQTATTGDFINKDVSLKGGVTLSIDHSPIDADALEKHLADNLGTDVSTSVVSTAGSVKGVIIEANIATEDSVKIQKLQDLSAEKLGIDLDSTNSNLEVIGSSLSKSFFQDTILAVLIAFIFMGIVVFIYFRNPAASGAVMLAAFSDIVVTIAIVNILGIKIGGGGIAAFLMMIGYSVDTDILLSVKVFKRKEGSVMDRIYNAMKTGLTMNVTTIVAISIALIFTKSEVIAQIMTILLIGLFVDIINTWIQNVGIIRYYLERKNEA